MKNIATNKGNDASAVLIKTEPSNTNQEVDNNQFQQPNASIQATKRPASLDLKNTTKKRLLAPSPLIIESSPEMQNSKPLTTPDLEKLLTFLPTPQPFPDIHQTKPAAVTSEQEAFGKGFEEALHSLHNNNSIQNHQIISDPAANTTLIKAANGGAATTCTTTVGMSGGSFTYTELENFNSIPIKDEPHNTSPPVSPIDMETQEKIKLERKRQRNRLAASKCRKRKLERISKLEDKVKMLKGENVDLGSIVKTLKEHVAQLKQKVIEHIGSGCSIETMCNGSVLLQSK